MLHHLQHKRQQHVCKCTLALLTVLQSTADCVAMDNWFAVCLTVQLSAQNADEANGRHRQFAAMCIAHLAQAMRSAQCCMQDW